MKRICFLGAGSWGTALAILCANNGHRVVLWSATNKFRKKREHVDCWWGIEKRDRARCRHFGRDGAGGQYKGGAYDKRHRGNQPSRHGDGGKMESFFGLSGIGDLIVTCTSTHSRNHNCGYLLGKGKTLEEAKKGILYCGSVPLSTSH